MSPVRTDDKRSWFRFDPTVNTGTLAEIVVLIVAVVMAYGAIDKQIASQQLQLDNMKANQVDEAKRVKEGIAELKQDVKEVAKSLNAVNESLAAIKAQQGAGKK